MTREDALGQIEKEFGIAHNALGKGNDGMARVCARRAAGIAITFWLAQKPDKLWGVDVMNKLRHLQMDNSIPADVREAASRLTTKMTDHHTLSHPTNPLFDSELIIDYFLSRTKKDTP